MALLCGGAPPTVLLSRARERDKTGAIPAFLPPRRTSLAINCEVAFGANDASPFAWNAEQDLNLYL